MSFGRAVRQIKTFVAGSSYEDLLGATPGWPWQMSPEQYAQIGLSFEALENTLLPDELAAPNVPAESRWPLLAQAMGLPLDRFRGLMKLLSGMLTPLS